MDSARRGFRAERATAKIQTKKSRIAAAFKSGHQEAFFGSSGSGDPAGPAASDEADDPDAADDADDVGKESGSGIISAIRSLIFSASVSSRAMMAS